MVLAEHRRFLGDLVADEAVGGAGVEDEPIRPLAVDLDADDHMLRLDQLERNDKLLGRLFLRFVLGLDESGKGHDGDKHEK